MRDVLVTYERSRARVTALTRGADGEVGVPACPAWTVREVLAHVVGLAEDVITENVVGFASDSWTSEHLARARDRTVRELLARWDDIDEPFRAAAEDMDPSNLFAPVALVAMYDLLTHEQDIRTALGAPRLHDPEDVDPPLLFAVESLRSRYGADNSPRLRIETVDGRSWVLGHTRDQAIVRAEPFELWRGLTGRRTQVEVRSLCWEGDVDAHIQRWLSPVFSWPGRSVGA